MSTEHSEYDERDRERLDREAEALWNKLLPSPQGMIDPVTGKELDAAWLPADQMPAPGKETEFYLVLLGENKRSVGWPDVKYRIQVMRINDRVTVIGGRFDFDCEPVVAFQPLAPLFKDES